MFNVRVRNKPRNNTDEIKNAITRYHDLGHCDRDGHTIPVHKRGSGKGDRNRLTPAGRRRFAENYDLIDWSN